MNVFSLYVVGLPMKLILHLRDWDFVIIEHEEVISKEMFTSINILNYKVVLPYNN